MKQVREMSIDDLNRLYTEGEECDKRMFAEMRTNLQLVAGEHYTREGSRFWSNVRVDKSVPTEQKLRITKNHIQRVTKIYRNSIESFAPGVTFVPANQSELSDQKAAELHGSYWQYIKRSQNLPEKIALWIKNFVEMGECWVKVYWSMDGGQVLGYQPQVQTAQMPDGTTQDQPLLGEDGQPEPDLNKPVYGGCIKFETIEAYNVRRDKSAPSMDESPYILVSKVLSKEKVKSFVSDPEMQKKIQDAPTQEYTVFDNNTGYYRTKEDQVLVKECYWRPCPSLPNGYFYIYTGSEVLSHGELPYGIFPICYGGFDEQTGNPRYHSVIRHCRPPQVEVNRCASKMAEHQITLGDDKVYIQQNAKLTAGSTLPGQRVNYYTGAKPEIMEGRSGAQYLEYMLAQIDEIYILANLKEILEEEPQGNDLYSSLFRSFRFRKKFAIYGEKFERFLIALADTALRISKQSASEEELVPAVGRGEYINMAEFKNSQDLAYQIKIESRSDDIESQFGQQITLNTILQYVGPQMEKDDIGQLIRLSPFLNKEKGLEKLTLKWDNITNDLLALDRGLPRPPRKYQDHKTYIQALTHRMSQSDYELLAPQVKMNYEMAMAQHQQLEAENLAEIQRAQAGFIPTTGYMAKVDLYEGDPMNPTKVKRISLPSDSVSWLVQALKKQGTEVMALEKLPSDALAEVSRNLQGMNPQGEPGIGARYA